VPALISVLSIDACQDAVNASRPKKAKVGGQATGEGPAWFAVEIEEAQCDQVAARLPDGAMHNESQRGFANLEFRGLLQEPAMGSLVDTVCREGSVPVSRSIRFSV
jgi:hypothetical protein